MNADRSMRCTFARKASQPTRLRRFQSRIPWAFSGLAASIGCHNLEAPTLAAHLSKSYMLEQVVKFGVDLPPPTENQRRDAGIAEILQSLLHWTCSVHGRTVEPLIHPACLPYVRPWNARRALLDHMRVAWHGMVWCGRGLEGAPVAVSGWVLTDRHDARPCAAKKFKKIARALNSTGSEIKQGLVQYHAADGRIDGANTGEWLTWAKDKSWELN